MRLPSKSFDNDDESDPYATVLFGDVRPLLFSLQSARAKNAFRLAWLSVLGLHIPGFYASLEKESSDDRWAHMHLTAPSYLSLVFPPIGMHRRITTDTYAGVVIGRQKEYASGFGPLRSWGFGVLDPLEAFDGGSVGLWRKEDVENEGFDVPFVRRVFEQLRRGNDDFEWDALALAFEAAVNMKG